jgi:uncharacterized membrane protein YeaQ/YmgE (transglycosylase-associated protein family)
MLMAVPTQEIKKDVDGELTKRQTIAAYTLITLGVVGAAAGAGKAMVSWLPKNTPPVLKIAAFVPAALVGAAIEVSIANDLGMLDFYKKHKWLLLGL